MSKAPSAAAEAYKEPDFAAYLAKPMTATQEHFHDWVIAKTGYDPAATKTKAQAFLDGIRIGTALRGIHQASPENQERLAEAKRLRDEAAAAEEAGAAPAKPAKAAKATPAAAPAKAAPAKAAKPPRATKAAKAVPAVTPEPEPEPETKPAARRRPPAKKSAAAPAKPRTGPVIVETGEDEAPF